jgi:hypothetical protein
VLEAEPASEPGGIELADDAAAEDENADGPIRVPMPPSSVIRMTSPDICQPTSVRVANWKTSALVPPARPASAADMTKAPSL